MTQVYVAVCGPNEATDEERGWAEEVGRRLAEAGAIVLCGGYDGVMDAVAKGASEAGGTVVGILTETDRTGASPHLTVSIPTGMGQTRNALIVLAADAVIAISGGFGTLSEVGLALRSRTPLVGLHTWELSKDGEPVDPFSRAATPAEAIELALALAQSTNEPPRPAKPLGSTGDESG